MRLSTGRLAGWIGCAIVVLLILACAFSLPYTTGRVTVTDDAASQRQPRRYEAGNLDRALLPPTWSAMREDEHARLDALAETNGERPVHLFGTDRRGRDLLVRCLTGGMVSLGVGIGAAFISVFVGTLYGTISGYYGGRVDAAMMRLVDIFFGLPYILLVVLLAIAVEGVVQRWELINDQDTISTGLRQTINVTTLIVAIAGVSWLTMARVIRGQVLSLKQQPFMQACRAIGVPRRQQFLRHLLPNLLGPIIVYATLTVPSAILSESFLSFLGIGIMEPLPSWGNLAADGLSELNVVRSRWWLLLWPCLLVAITLLSLNFLGESLREVFDPRRRIAGGATE
jgi:oligopeptide transport system permease protein